MLKRPLTAAAAVLLTVTAGLGTIGAAAAPAAPSAARLHGAFVFSAVALYSGDTNHYGVGAPSDSTLVPVGFGATSAAAAAKAVAWSFPAVDESGPLSPDDDAASCLYDPAGPVLATAACDGTAAQQWQWVDLPSGKGLQNIATGRYLGTASEGYDDSLQGSADPTTATGAVEVDRLTDDGMVTPPANGGIDDDALGFPATIAAGGRGTVSVGVRVTDDLTALSATTITLDAPAGTTFDRSQTQLDAEQRTGPTAAWTAAPDLRVTGTVSADGLSFHGTIADAGGAFRVPAGTELRWGITVVAGAPTR